MSFSLIENNIFNNSKIEIENVKRVKNVKNVKKCLKKEFHKYKYQRNLFQMQFFLYFSIFFASHPSEFPQSSESPLRRLDTPQSDDYVMMCSSEEKSSLLKYKKFWKNLISMKL